MMGTISTIGPEAGDAAAVVLDLTGLKCPLPALRTRKALRDLAPGSSLIVTASDPLAGLDIPNVVREEGATIQAQTRHAAGERTGSAATWRFAIRKAG